MWINTGPALYVTADRATVVPEGDARAAFLLVCAGGSIPLADAERYGLTDEAKTKAAATNKARRAPANKGTENAPPASPDAAPQASPDDAPPA